MRTELRVQVLTGRPRAESGCGSAAGGEGRDDRLRDVPGVHQQSAGDLGDLGPVRDQYFLAMAPRGELVAAEAPADGGAEPPRVAAVIAPRGQPFAQLIIAEHGPGHEALGDLPGGVHHERLVADSLDAVYPAFGVAAGVDARRAEPGSHGERGHRVTRLRSEEHTSELQSRENLVCRLLLEKKKKVLKSRVKSKKNSIQVINNN